MAELVLTANGTNLTIENKISIVGTQVNYDTCRFVFDSAWDGYTKTAVFYQNPTEKTHVLLDETNTCHFPWESVRDGGILYIGVFGMLDDVILPTNFVIHRVITGSYDGIAPPTEDVQDDLTTHITNTDNPHNVTAEQVKVSNTHNFSADDLEGIVEQIDAALIGMSDEVGSFGSQVGEHIYNEYNPHNVTAEQISVWTSALGANDVKGALLELYNLIQESKIYYIATDYGVAGDGIADDFTALNDLVQLVYNNGGGTIYLPEGVYNLSWFLYWQSNVSLVGAGKGKTILKPTGSVSAISYPVNDYDYNNPMINCSFNGFTIDGIDVDVSYTSDPKGIFILFLKGCVFKNLEIKNTAATGLGIDFLDDVVIDNVTATNCGRLWEDDGDWGAPGGAGIGIGTGGMENENCIITNCICANNGHYGIFVEDQRIFGQSPSFTPKGIIITNNIVRDGRRDGIGVKGGEEIVISNNIIYGHAGRGSNGILISYEAKNVHLIGNISTGNFRNLNIDNSQGDNLNITVLPEIVNDYDTTPGKLTLNKYLNQYVELPNQVGYMPEDEPFTIVFKFNFEITEDATFISRQDSSFTTTFGARGWALRLANDHKIKLECYITNGADQMYRKGSFAFEPYTIYWLKFEYTGTEFKFYYSTDGSSFTQDTISVESGTDIDLRSTFAFEGESFETYFGKMVWPGTEIFAGIIGGLYSCHIWKDTNDIEGDAAHIYLFNNDGVDMPVLDFGDLQMDGVTFNGATQESL